MLSIKTERAGDVVVVKCAGRIVRGLENALRNAVMGSSPARVVVLDLSDVDAVDAGGLNLLVSLHRWTEASRMHLKLVNPRPFVNEMLTRTHLDCVFDISSLGEALAVLGDCQCQSHGHTRLAHAVA
jgi:anti-anti-sigma factor